MMVMVMRQSVAAHCPLLINVLLNTSQWVHRSSHAGSQLQFQAQELQTAEHVTPIPVNKSHVLHSMRTGSESSKDSIDDFCVHSSLNARFCFTRLALPAFESHSSVVYGLDGPGFEFPVGALVSSLLQSVQTGGPKEPFIQ